MGPVRLPFNGTDAGFNEANDATKYLQIFHPMAGGTQKDTILYVGVVFSVPLGTGVVKLGVPKLAGGTVEQEFDQAANVAQMIAVPFTEDGLWIHSISKRAKGEIVVATSN